MVTPFLLNGVALFNPVISPVMSVSADRNFRYCSWELRFPLMGTPVPFSGNDSFSLWERSFPMGRKLQLSVS
ncbi:hypothetical protein [Bacteroides intestinalis]|uniref:Uncharacterized protein n=1 Tax=Bacteroides intestinalis TaxID=329854 RepID=A0A642CRC4_9BACE|nr:hypothetical protein [Bacteroides intestinalis]KAA4691188.1 hypothetical protein F3B37_12935 [Bacteroides intestinalis]MCB6676933.1 hypothetical protein [Bacteroides intestinalis]MCB7014531.1 hypothetical protein [Bacteroides intestinalis]MCG4701691.1 hypothetical protein [Bacteroides intestinalis]MCG4717429.1 hypothetical protein [Bacteroides intestinalis]